MPSLFNAEIATRALAAAAGRRLRPPAARGPVDLFLCIVDHFEPQVGGAGPELARERLEDWLRRYPEVARRHRDADGRVPPHSFFYPWDEYDEGELARLAELCAGGFGEIEIHLHHANDTESTLREKFRAAVAAYRRHGALSAWPDGRPAWGFVHGDWALDNSRWDNGENYCGVNSEITILQEEGCYADFTFPSLQQTSQPRQLNSIYYAVDDPQRPKSHDRGVPARAGCPGKEGLLLVHGPLVPHGKRRGGLPWLAMDDGDLAAYRRYEPARLDRWVRAAIHVQGRPDRVFVKLHCHGASDRHRAVLLGEDLDALFADAGTRYNDGVRYCLHHVSARELFNVVKATEAAPELDATGARDYLLPPPLFTGPQATEVAGNKRAKSACAD